MQGAVPRSRTHTPVHIGSASAKPGNAGDGDHDASAPGLYCPVQVCVVDNRPLKREQYELILDAAISFEKIAVIVPQIQSIAECEFIEDVFVAITENDCPKLRDSTRGLATSAIFAAAALTVAAFYFCVCIRYDESDPENVIPAGTHAFISDIWRFFDLLCLGPYQSTESVFKCLKEC